MKNLFLCIFLCALSNFSFSQEVTNKTDAKGLKQGKWAVRYSGGGLKYEGTFDHNKPVGEWKRYHENGKIKAYMHYRTGSERVSASLFDETGVLYARGVFEGTLRDSVWNFYSGEKIVQTENYHLGRKEGISIEYFTGGVKKSEITYREGKKNGPAVVYDESGLKTMEGSYKDDLSDGEWTLFERDGSVKTRIKYDKGEILDGKVN